MPFDSKMLALMGRKGGGSGGEVWLEDETYTIVDNEALENTGDDFQISKSLERGFSSGDTVTVTLIHESGESVTVSAVASIAYNNDGEYSVAFKLSDLDQKEDTIVYYDQRYHSLYINTVFPGTMTVKVTSKVIKTNCDLLIKSSYVWNDDDSIYDVQLISGDYASVKAKIEKGLPVTAFECATANEYGSIKKSNLPIAFIELIYPEDEDEYIYFSGCYASFLLYPDNTLEHD